MQMTAERKKNILTFSYHLHVCAITSGNKVYGVKSCLSNTDQIIKNPPGTQTVIANSMSYPQHKAL
uniref:Uncharacterized protein n=1 Tax=Anguilla anguilla TaxID=7936 RepID=A0A0E9SFA0_ANGAN